MLFSDTFRQISRLILHKTGDVEHSCDATRTALFSAMVAFAMSFHASAAHRRCGRLYSDNAPRMNVDGIFVSFAGASYVRRLTEYAMHCGG